MIAFGAATMTALWSSLLAASPASEVGPREDVRPRDCRVFKSPLNLMTATAALPTALADLLLYICRSMAMEDFGERMSMGVGASSGVSASGASSSPSSSDSNHPTETAASDALRLRAVRGE